VTPSARAAADRSATPPPRIIANGPMVRAQSPSAGSAIRYQSPIRQEDPGFALSGSSFSGSVIRGVSATSRGFGPRYDPANDPHARLVAVTDNGWIDATGQVHAFRTGQAPANGRAPIVDPPFVQGTAALRQRSEPARR
jgi:hypothetical protein